MTSLQRDDRQLIENQLRELNGMMRQMSLMASTLDRRLRRMQRTTSPLPRRRVQPRVPDAPRANRVREPVELRFEPINLEEVMNQVEQPMEIVEPVNPINYVYPDVYIQQVMLMLANGQIHFHEMPENLQRQMIEMVGHEEIQQPVRRVRLPKQKSVALKKTDVTLPMTNPCPICYEPYTQIQSCLLNCQHHMCKDCIQQWTTSQSAQGHEINCPLCRVKTTTVIEYRERAKRSVKSVENRMDVVVDEVDTNV
jgi:hypothetical protein